MEPAAKSMGVSMCLSKSSQMGSPGWRAARGDFRGLGRAGKVILESWAGRVPGKTSHLSRL